MNENEIEVIIFAHARSGSNNLTKILTLHPELNFLFEPFSYTLHSQYNPKFTIFIKDILSNQSSRSLDNYLKKIALEYNGIKTLFNHIGPYLNKHLLEDKKRKIVFLTRDNLLKTAVSSFIAKKTRTWLLQDEKLKKYKSELEDLKLDKILVQDLEKAIIKTRDQTNIYLNFLKNNKIEYMHVKYEDIFEKTSIKLKVQKIKEIFNFLGYNFPEDRLEKIKSLLDPENNQMNNKFTYNLIPNIKEIEEKLGSKENGYLFKKISDNKREEFSSEKIQIIRNKLISIKNKINNQIINS